MDFDWGENKQIDIDIIEEEIFKNKIYEKYFTVNRDDIVLDIGANVGAFTYSILGNNPSKVFCIEPSDNLANTLRKNVCEKNIDVIIEQKAIREETEDDVLINDKSIIFSNSKDTFDSISFKDFIEKYNIEKIDFMKVDCENGEYYIFTEENFDYIEKNVNKISGEIHLWGFLDKFKKFRDLYLKRYENLRVHDFSGANITDKIFDDNFLEKYADEKTYSAQITIYKSNEEIKMKSIPVIGAPVVTNPYWVHRLIMSVDYPVDEFVIINNNGRGEIDDELDKLKNMTHKFIKNIKVVHMPANIGCAGAWNLIIKSYMMAPYWIIVNDDIAFNRGLLKEMVELIESDEHLGMIHPNAGDFDVGSWDLFLIRDNIVKQFGLFDENTYPAYCEDADYLMRFIYRPIKKVVGLRHTYLHGIDEATSYYESGSQTKKSDPDLESKLNNANILNIEYLNEKWGEGWRQMGPTPHPYNNEGIPMSYTKYDLEFVRRKHMGF